MWKTKIAQLHRIQTFSQKKYNKKQRQANKILYIRQTKI